MSASLRPYLIAGLTEIGVSGAAGPGADGSGGPRPTLVVVGDDRAARELAADLRAWLAPRRVRYYPSRGVTYESHLTPPAHLIGLRVAALDALLAENTTTERVGGPQSWSSPRWRSPRRCPTRRCARARSRCAGASCSTWRSARTSWWPRGTSASTRWRSAGQFAMRGGLLDIFPATEERAVRVDMFDVEIESLRWFSTFTQRSLGEVEEVEIAPAAELAAEHRELAEIAALEDAAERPDIAELLPVERFGALLDLLDAGRGARGGRGPRAGRNGWWAEPRNGGDRRRRGGARPGARGPLERRVRGLPRRRRPPPVRESRDGCGRRSASARASGSPRCPPTRSCELRAQSADTAARSLAEAEPQLEKLVRSGYRTVVAFPHRGEGERAAYNLARLKATWLSEAGALADRPGAVSSSESASTQESPRA